MWVYNQTDYLCHFGVPGMKWGHRKTSYDNPNMSSAKRALYDSKANKKLPTANITKHTKKQEP